jgi:ABC-type transporter MlaC component
MQEKEQLEIRNDNMQAQFNSLKAEHYKLMSDNQEKSEKLTQELANSVNLEYLKNILMSYFMTNDASV